MEALKQGADVLFILMGAVMVLAMHAGFAFLELGTVRRKNQVNALVKILVDFSVSTVVYFAVGYAVAYGTGFFIGAEQLAANNQTQFEAVAVDAHTTGTGIAQIAADESDRVTVKHIDPEQVVDHGATIKLGEICTRLGFTVTADFLASLGVSPVATEKNAKLYPAAKFPSICRLISDHVLALAFKKAA